MRWIKQKWRAWRLLPGLAAAAEIANSRAYSHPLAKDMGPEVNLLYLGNDLIGLRHRLLLKQEPLGPEFEKILHDNLWDLYAR